MSQAMIAGIMNFHPQFENSLIDGSKTQSGRVIKVGGRDRFKHMKPGDRFRVDIERRMVGTLTILRVEVKRVNDLTDEDAAYSGFMQYKHPLTAYKFYWDRRWYAGQPDVKWDRNPEVGVVVFSFSRCVR